MAITKSTATTGRLSVNLPYRKSFMDLEAPFNTRGGDFSVFFQGVANTSMLMSGIHPFNSDQSSLFKFIADDHWTPENPDAAYPRLITNINSHNNFESSTYWFTKRSFLASEECRSRIYLQVPACIRLRRKLTHVLSI